jgi:glycine cleavage system protein P-like pyridoxal-binding family
LCHPNLRHLRVKLPVHGSNRPTSAKREDRKTVSPNGPTSDCSYNSLSSASAPTRELSQHILPVPHGDRCLHEFVATASKLKADRGVSAMDLAKRLLDYGYHAPTVYFPLVVPEALMIEPTETEPKERLDEFCDAMLAIVLEAATDADLLHTAPHTRPVTRLDEVKAAKRSIVKYGFEEHPSLTEA